MFLNHGKQRRSLRRHLLRAVACGTGLALLCGCSAEPADSRGSGSSAAGGTGRTESTAAGETDEIALTGAEFAVTPQTVRMLGRHHIDTAAAAYGFYNVAAGISFAFEGTSLALQLSADAYQEYNLNYVAVTVDSGEPIPVCVDKNGWYAVAEGLEPGVRHTVTVLKRTMTNAGAVRMHRVRLSEGARLFRVPVTETHRIQVLGDSITCGYGTLWDGSDTQEVTCFQNGTGSFAALTARRLNAELQVVAISGIGVGNVENKPYPLLPAYEQEDMQNGVPCDWDAFVPEVVVIALGTNDVGQKNPPDTFRANASRMIRRIREHYPEATIIWTYGVMGGQEYVAVIRSMIEALQAAGDSNLYFLQTAPPTEEEYPLGQHGHPGQKTHERIADELTAMICRIRGWEEIV